MTRRPGVASVIGTVFFVLVFMMALGAMAYASALQSQSAGAQVSAEQVAASRGAESLTFDGQGSGLAAVVSGPTTAVVNHVVLRFPNGTVYPLPASAAIPTGGSLNVQALIPAGVCSPGTATCLSKYNQIVAGNPPGASVGLVTSMGNVFWYTPSISLVRWSLLTDLPAGCTTNQYVTGLGPSLTCSQVAWSQLTGYPSPCASNQYVSAYGSTLACSSISLPWSQLAGFPSACPPGQSISQLGATPTCSSAGALAARVSSNITNSGVWETALSVQLSPDTNYVFSAYLFVDSSANWNVELAKLPSGAALQEGCLVPFAGSLSSDAYCNHKAGSPPQTLAFTSGVYMVEYYGGVTVGGTGGPLAISFECYSYCGSVTIIAGSFMTVQSAT